MIIKNINDWQVVDTFRVAGETLHQIRIGEFDNRFGHSPNYDILMRKSTYSNLISKIYSVTINNKKLRVIDMKGHYIPKIILNGVCCEIY